MKKIDNLSIVKSDSGYVELTWNWPAGVQCVRIVYLNRLSKTAPESMSFAELNKVSDMCFVQEFKNASNVFRHIVDVNDKGKLSFMVYACSDDGSKLDPDFHSDAVSDSTHSSVIMFSVKYQKGDKRHKVGFITINAETDIDPGIIDYVVGGNRYRLGEIVQGQNQFGPVILATEQYISLNVSEKYSGEYTLKHN